MPIAGTARKSMPDERIVFAARPHFRLLRPAWLRPRGSGDPMDSGNIFHMIDRICGQFAAALQHSELKIYTTIALVIVLSALLFPPKNDPDQI
jgi:hypothetical protein